MDANQLARDLGNWTEARGPLHTRLASALERSIRHGFLPPGTRLPAERSLAQCLAVSRTTVLGAYTTLKTDGWLESRPGSGTWVRAQAATTARQQNYVHTVEGSTTLSLLQVEENDIVDLAVGTTRPLTDLPAGSYHLPASSYTSLLDERHYRPLGYAPLRQAIADYYTSRHLPTTAEQILITSGAQQAISLVVSAFVQRGDSVLIENPTFFGALDVLRFAGAQLTPVSVTPTHVRPAELRDRIPSSNCRLVVLTPTFHNPTGAVMPEPARAEVARLGEQFGIPILEDHSLGEFGIEQESPPVIASFADASAGGASNIITLGSLSKLFWFGLRIGWLRAPVSLVARLARVKTAADLGSPILPQAIAVQLFGNLQEAKALRREQFRHRRDLLASLLRQHLPEWQFDVPRGGLFLWVRLPGYDARQFAQMAARHGVALTPGTLFAPDESWTEYLRLPYVLEEDRLRLGVQRMAEAWQVFLSSAAFRMPRLTALV